jgi:acetyl-CoA C-acetyltransferase
MGSHGIRDQVAIVGMGCTPFAEHWDKGLDDLIIDASTETFTSAGIGKDDVDAYWFGTAQSGMSGITLARPLQLRNKPVTRVENYCTTGSEALRAAAYAVACGAYDVAMAVGAEKVKDSGFQGLNAMNPPNDGTARTLTAAAMFSMVAPAYGQKYGVDDETMADVLATTTTGPATRGPSSVARSPRKRPWRHPGWPAASACSIVPAWPMAPPRPSSCVLRTRCGTPTSLST